MVKLLVAWMFFLAFVIQAFNKPFILFDYYTNTRAYAKNCINKAKPKLHCNGKCQMMKKLQEEEKKEQQNEERKSSHQFEVLSSKSFFASLEYPVPAVTKNFTKHPEGNLSDITYSFFHPPSA
jgi:hypothetical protein